MLKNALDRKLLFFLPHTSRITNMSSFYAFASERLGKWLTVEKTVDTCLQAMQEGVLDVCAQNRDGLYLWSYYGMTPGQWQRVCGLLQRAGIANSILWESKWFTYHGFMAEIEYFWTDLDAVQKVHQTGRGAIAREVMRRRWLVSLRRAWLAACTILS